MIVKIGLLGASGKMGLAVSDLLTEGFRYGGNQLELADAVAGSKKLRSLEGVEIRRLEEQAREPVHVWIDFSRPEATLALLRKIETPIVIGTTGFTDEQKDEIYRYAERFPVLLAANTSPGMNLMQAWLRQMPKLVDIFPHCVFEEAHHSHKKDSPSGSTKACLEILQNKGYEQVQVHVTRAGAIVGDHAVRLISDEEEVEITHRVTDRKVFARGALLGVFFILGRQTPRVYEMKEVWEMS
jgi:4-hydroxy-tetrahydrodipicolinate reductase